MRAITCPNPLRYALLGMVSPKKVVGVFSVLEASFVIETKKGVKTQHNVLQQIGVDPGKYNLKIL